MTDLAMGANAPLSSPEFVLDVHLPQGVPTDVSALQLYSGDKVRGDGDMCFFNQPSIGAGAVSLAAGDEKQSFSFNLALVHGDVEKIVINATMESGQFSAVDELRITTSSGISMSVETSGRTEAALILCEIYKRNGQWKIRNVSQGFNGGLQALAEHFGVEVAEPSASEPAIAPATSSSVASSAPASAPAAAPAPAAPAAPASGRPSGSGAPAMFDRLKQTAQQTRSRLATEALRFKNRSFMEAVVNGCVLVAAADGGIDASEKQKMAGFIERSDELKHFDMREVIDVFQKAAAECESDDVLGKASALEKIRKVQGKDDQARLLVRVVCAIGAADGDFDTQEKAMVIEIARELALDPADFDLQ
ncbi:MAG: TerD family protein [Granulosicoccus sp.]